MPEREPIVLLVDDDPALRSALAGVLADSGLATAEASSGSEALELLQRVPVDAVVVDQSMPGMTGLELTRRLRDMPAHRLMPVLFFSADDEPATRLAALRTGATDFMVKPLPFDEVAARIHSQLRIARGWAAAASRLARRASTVAELAAVASDEMPELTAQVLCERISESHGGVGAAVYAWEYPGMPLLGGTGADWPFDAEPEVALRLRGESGAWVHRGAVYAPLHHAGATLGALAVELRGADVDEMLAAVMDYASAAASRLGPDLEENRRSGEHRGAVRHLLESGAFRPVFQPIVDLTGGEVVGYEALTRLADGRPILEFLADAERASLRSECELTLVSAALTESAGGVDGRWVSINLSPSVLVGNAERVAELVEGASAEVVIELTENERVDDNSAILAAVGALGEGVKLSMDDTGSGYSSLRRVVDLRPHFLKLDRSWIAELDADDTRQAMVAGLVAFCRHTGTELIAEGIEREPERAVLEDLGVSFGQGYLLGRPAPLPRRP
jgi:EAL domain-containing protein (putative c-di-GMP-specific phosphodiesterase class I)/CheY-like chemotaxis protein